jgi:hypothetical protein
MNTTGLLPTLVLSAALLLPSTTAIAEDDGAETAQGADATAVAPDSIAELEAIMPSELAGLELAENLQLASGEQLFSVMRQEEAALLLEVFDANDKTVADYAAATALLPVSESDIVIVQAHRIAGIDAAATIETWVAVLSVKLQEPVVARSDIDGRTLTLVSDATRPEVPLLYLFAAGDIVWMIVTTDQSIVAEAMDAVGVDVPKGTEPAA